MTEEKRGPGRPKKQDKPDRRRKGKIGDMHQRLGMSEADRDPNFTYRYINDVKSRVHDMTVDDDWDVVRLPGEDGEPGAVRTEIVGTGSHGEPIKAILVRKPIDYYNADKAEAAAEIDKKVEGIRGARGQHTYGETTIK